MVKFILICHEIMRNSCRNCQYRWQASSTANVWVVLRIYTLQLINYAVITSAFVLPQSSKCELFASKQRKKKSYKRISWSGGFFDFNWKITFNGHRSYITRSQFNNCRVLVVYQVTVNNRYWKCPPPASLRAWMRLIMDCRALSESRGGCDWFERHKMR